MGTKMLILNAILLILSTRSLSLVRRSYMVGFRKVQDGSAKMGVPIDRGFFNPPDAQPILNTCEVKDIASEYAKIEVAKKRRFMEDWAKKNKAHLEWQHVAGPLVDCC
jgi:hypothetical protein